MEINKVIRGLVEQYQQKQWEIELRDVGFFKAREELLSCGALYIFELKSTVGYPLYDDRGRVYHPPLIANNHGVFGMYINKPLDIIIDKPVTIQIHDKNGMILVSVDLGVDKNE